MRRKIAPLKVLLETSRGKRVPLPPSLQHLYGNFRLRSTPAPYVCGNLVTSLDGVVSLNRRKHASGGDISGFSIQDRMVMGLLRSIADVVILGSASVNTDHLWTAAGICPELAADYARFEEALRKRQPALNVIISASGALNMRRTTNGSDCPLLVVTTSSGAKRLSKQRLPSSVQVCAVRSRAEMIKPASILEAIDRQHTMHQVLVEGGPRLLATFYAAGLMDEQFLTLAPQIAGRIEGDGRPGLVMGHTFAPERPLWGSLLDVRSGSGLLFLRYSFH